MYIADTYNYRVRKVTVSTSIITTIAGTGSSTYNGDGGAATSAALNLPWGVALDTSGIHGYNACMVPILITLLEYRQRVHR